MSSAFKKRQYKILISSNHVSLKNDHKNFLKSFSLYPQNLRLCPYLRTGSQYNQRK